MKSVLLACLLIASASFAVNAQAEIKPHHSAGNKAAAAQRATPPRVATPFASSSTKQAPRMINTWYNLFGGVLLGLGVGSVMSASAQHPDWADNISSLLYLLLGLFVAVKVWQSMRHQRDTDYDWETYVPEIDARIESAGLQLPLPVASDVGEDRLRAVHGGHELISGFDASVFVNQAKTRFVCLQLAWDKDDFNSIRSFTTPAMFVALRQQAQKPGRIARRTDVVQLFGTLLTVDVHEKEYIASVSFEGLMKPLPDASAEPFSEIWHITRPLVGKKGWALAGIQKIS